MKKINFLLTGIILINSLVNFSQVIEAKPIGSPLSFSDSLVYNIRSSSSLTSINLPAVDNNVLRSFSDSIKQNCTSCDEQKYYGSGILNFIDLKSSAQYYNPNIEEGKLWILKISSPTAIGLGFYFSKFNLPEESSLFIYTADTVIYGPYTAHNNPSDTSRQVQFGTIPIMGNEVYLEYYESDSAEFSGSIIINNIIHVYDSPYRVPTRDPSSPCQNDAACKAGWGKEINSVALIYSYNPSLNLAGQSTGALINNTSQDGTPYFLTAAHIYNSTVSGWDPSTWNFVFDYENLSCLPSFASLDPIPNQIIYGAEVLIQDQIDATDPNNVKSVNSDYMLLKLFSTPFQISNMGLCYSGWSYFPPLTQFSFSASDEFTFISHPNGDVKKIAVGNDLRQSGTVGTWNPTDIYKLDVIYGAGLEAGASGCPLYNSNHKIIGTSSGHGGFPSVPYDPCNTVGPLGTGGQYFGRFDRHWLLGSLKQWLDPLELTDANPYYDGPPSYCPNPAAQVIEPPVISSTSGVNSGFKINEVSGAIVTFCSTDDYNNLTIEPKFATYFYIDGYINRVKCNTQISAGTGELRDGCEQVTILSIPTGKCDCAFHSYYIYITELDYNLVPTGTNYVKRYEQKTWTAGVHDLAYFSVNVPDVIGTSFSVGKFYRIGISNLVGSNWRWGSQILHILPNSITISNTTIGTNIYAISDITLNNANVYSPVSFVASNQITINPNSSLEAGEYTIEEVDCEAFRMAEIHNSDNIYTLAQNNSLGNFISSSKEKKTSSALQTNNLTIFPNPSDGVFQILVTKNNQPIGVKEIKVYDIVGKTICSINSSSNNAFKIDISFYPQGIYYVYSINELGEIDVLKYIKQN